MKRKPIRVDWDEIESAFNNKNEELRYYLDLVTGHVVLEGEGELDLDDDDDAMVARGMRIAVTSGEDTRLAVEPPGDEQKLVWLDQFLDREEIAPEIVDSFQTVMKQPDIAAIRDLMQEHGDVRDAWYVYRSERLREQIDRWIAANELQLVEPPPWR